MSCAAEPSFFEMRLEGGRLEGSSPLGMISKLTRKNTAGAPKECDASEATPKSKIAGIVGGTSARTLLSSDTCRERLHWSPSRRKAARIFESRPFDIVMGAIILFNVGLMVIEADAGSICTDEFSLCTPEWVIVLNSILLAIYSVELIARLCVYRLKFFGNRWNIIDAVIVLVAYVEVIISTAAKVPGMQLVRIFRLGRLARLLRVLKVFPMLYSMVRGFANTMTTIIWGFFLILALLLVWSLLTVELVHPRNKLLYAKHGGDTSDWCFVAFSSVGSSILYYFQTLVAGDSWGACSIPLMQEYHLTFWIFSLAYITVQLGFTNLVLAVIVDAAAKARDEDLHQKMKKKKKQEKEATERLLNVIKRMDLDDDKKISWEELQSSFQSDPEVQDLMKMLNINDKELRRMFDFMDSDKNGSVDYSEFVEAISKAQESDMRVQLMMLQLHISDIGYLLESKLGSLGKNSQTFSNVLSGASSSGPPRPPPSPSVAAPPPTVLAPAPESPSLPVPLVPISAPSWKLLAENSPSGGEGREGTPETRGSPWEAVTMLERELRVLGTSLGDRLEALAQDAAAQVSVLTRQTRSLSAALGSARGELDSQCLSARSQWSKVKDIPMPAVVMNCDLARAGSQELRASGPRPEVSRSAYAVTHMPSDRSRGASKGLPQPCVPISGSAWLRFGGGVSPVSPKSASESCGGAEPSEVREDSPPRATSASTATESTQQMLRASQRSGYL